MESIPVLHKRLKIRALGRWWELLLSLLPLPLPPSPPRANVGKFSLSVKSNRLTSDHTTTHRYHPGSVTCYVPYTPVVAATAIALLDFILRINYSTLLRLPPLRFNCVGRLLHGIEPRIVAELS